MSLTLSRTVYRDRLGETFFHHIGTFLLLRFAVWVLLDIDWLGFLLCSYLCISFKINKRPWELCPPRIKKVAIFDSLKLHIYDSQLKVTWWAPSSSLVPITSVDFIRKKGNCWKLCFLTQKSFIVSLLFSFFLI